MPNRTENERHISALYGYDTATGQRLLVQLLQDLGHAALTDHAIATLAAAHLDEHGARQPTTSQQPDPQTYYRVEKNGEPTSKLITRAAVAQYLTNLDIPTNSARWHAAFAGDVINTLSGSICFTAIPVCSLR